MGLSVLHLRLLKKNVQKSNGDCFFAISTQYASSYNSPPPAHKRLGEVWSGRSSLPSFCNACSSQCSLFQAFARSTMTMIMTFAILMLMMMTIDDDIDDYDDDLSNASRSKSSLFQAFARLVMHDKDKNSKGWLAIAKL